MTLVEFDPDAYARTHGEEPPPAVERLGALDSGPDEASRQRLATLTWRELEQLAIAEPPTQVVDGLIAEGERVLVYGFTNVGKSIFTRDLAVAVHRGEAFLGHFATARRRVGIIDEESPAQRLGEQLVRAARAHGVDAADADLPIFAVRQGVRLDTAEGIDAIAGWIACNALQVLIIDALIRTHRLRENDAEDMARIDEATRELQARASGPLTVVLVHHAPKPRETGTNDPVTMARGSSDLIGGVDSALYLRRTKEAGQLVCEHAKSRWSQTLPPFLIRIEGSDDALRMAYGGTVDDLAGLTERAIEVMLVALRDGPRSRGELVIQGKAANVRQRAVDEALAQIVADGKAAKGRSGRAAIYSLTAGGVLA